MDKKIFGVIAAISGLGTLGAAQAAPAPVDVNQAMNAQSFSELLEPIPNATALLIADDESRAKAPEAAKVQLAQDHHHHHHHHGLINKLLRLPHHHHHYRYYHHHHHHHHHHQSY